MSETNGAGRNGDGNGHRRGIRFDPTINLGHILTAGAFLITTALAWANLDSRVTGNARDIDRVEKIATNVPIAVENRLMSRINEERARLDQTAVRMADDVREIKTIMRDGFRELDTKLDRKADKPGR